MIPCGNENILGRSRVLRAAAFKRVLVLCVLLTGRDPGNKNCPKLTE